MDLYDGIRELDRPFMHRSLCEVYEHFTGLYNQSQRFRLMPEYAEEIQTLKTQFFTKMREARRLSRLFENSLNPMLFLEDLVNNIEDMKDICHRLATIIQEHYALPILPREEEDG
ncbi:unnamed protein product [Caenorhabditis angaria]|uniref:Uncharacterized protein n=1 Tax=Caenorhabditis angaria TaxID=860376 RepID=A0A9P1N871_9PELO|nr:unnamed protein product [Caenorhabditis angaria]